MKLNIAINALAASLSSFPSASASGAVTKNLKNGRVEGGNIRAAASKNQGAECSFAVGIEVQNSPDVGVLSCKVGETCIEDSMSSIGGRCVVSSDEVALKFDTSEHMTEYAAEYGEAKQCKTCDEAGKKFKCCGEEACHGLDEKNVPCGSCNGKVACSGAKGAIGRDSCVGEFACFNSSGELSQFESPCYTLTDHLSS